MFDWADVRALARSCRREAGLHAPIDEALAAAFAARRLTHEIITPSDGFGANVRGAMERSGRTIYTAPGLSAEESRFVKAHELGHFVLHTDPRLETTVLSYAGEAGLFEGYSARGLAEVQADVFAIEFLCPTDTLRDELASSEATPARVAAKWGLARELVLRQTTRTLLEPQEAPLAARPTTEPAPEWMAAAEWTGGNVLVQGPPGTGKTTTCARRVVHLLEHGVSPACIAVVCRDEASARRLRAAIIAETPQAVQVWFGTIRGFALEIVGACASRIDRTCDFDVLDEAGALAAIKAAAKERTGAEDGLDAVQTLHAIKRCKKTMVRPHDLEQTAARLDDARLNGLAQAWRAYEGHLAASNRIEASDLTGAALRALDHAEVREMAGRRCEYLIVDDFEELCGVDHALVRCLAGLGVNVFAAGDAKSSIYGFKDARPDALDTFETDFTNGKRLQLRRQHLGPPAIDAAADRFLGLDRAREQTAAARPLCRLTVSVAPHVEGEAAAIARRVQYLRSRGIAYRDQAILARSHNLLDDLAPRLEARGIPVTHLGEIADRPEVRDLLAVASIAGDAAADLVRVAALPIYGVSNADASRVIGHAHANGITVLECLRRIDTIDGVSARSRSGLTRLRHDLDGIGPGTAPWTVLTTWLFERSDYLRTIPGDAGGSSKLEAIRLVLGVCDEQMRYGDNDMATLTARLARIRSLDQDTHYGRTRLDDDGTDRVQMMTIHAAKGRHFEAVHVPGLAAGRMPVNRAPPADPLIQLAAFALSPSRRGEEERAIFATAITRARSHLHLSRAECYGRAARRSRFLDELGPTVIERPVDQEGRALASRRRGPRTRRTRPAK